MKKKKGRESPEVRRYTALAVLCFSSLLLGFFIVLSLFILMSYLDLIFFKILNVIGIVIGYLICAYLIRLGLIFLDARKMYKELSE